jgi:malonyl-CoA O-methyltransferase
MIKNKIQQAFDRAAHSYDKHSDVQQQAGIKLTHLLKSLRPQAKHLLDMGCGTGMTTAYLASQYQYEDFHAIDIAPSLLAKAHQRLANLAIHVYEKNFDELAGQAASLDIIYSNMAVQWSRNLSALLQTTHTLLKDEGLIALSIPLAGTFTELHSYCELNALYDHETIANILTQSGYHILLQETESITLSFPHIIHAIKSIKQIGANHVIQRSCKGLGKRSPFKKMGSSQLTYVIGYFIARKNSV